MFTDPPPMRAIESGNQRSSRHSGAEGLGREPDPALSIRSQSATEHSGELGGRQASLALSRWSPRSSWPKRRRRRQSNDPEPVVEAAKTLKFCPNAARVDSGTRFCAHSWLRRGEPDSDSAPAPVLPQTRRWRRLWPRLLLRAGTPRADRDAFGKRPQHPPKALPTLPALPALPTLPATPSHQPSPSPSPGKPELTLAPPELEDHRGCDAPRRGAGRSHGRGFAPPGLGERLVQLLGPFAIGLCVMGAILGDERNQISMLGLLGLFRCFAWLCRWRWDCCS